MKINKKRGFTLIELINYDLITENDVNNILEVKLEDELQYISTESFEEVIKNIEIDTIGSFKKLNK